MEAFIDSNIIIEAFKKRGSEEASEILNLILQENVICFINIIVESEVVFYLITKGKGKLNLRELEEFLDFFEFLSTNKNIQSLFKDFVEKYKLKPNDAIILSTCKYYGVPYLISLDSDFEKPCKEEGIELVSSSGKLKEVLS